ncbi:MAG: methyltransferase domain-containing protein [Clostridiales bacterium]|nr:methyltransferase domain-containing protein [Clostridiales bacterium]
MQNTTLKWYQENADKFLKQSLTVDMTALYQAFLKYVAPGGKIMDLGCGSGVASLYFIQNRFDALPADGCTEMCEAATKLTGRQARNILFDELDYENEFDGIWACSSLLHVSKKEMPKILTLIKYALKEGGILYASYKYGEKERKKNGRSFSDYTEETLKALVHEVGGLQILDLWVTNDARPQKANEKWVNVICRKTEPN